ncbi:BCHE [Symbiodinium sp. KB8]|nr:BCHE [Symbiodinium sp. KB8]
MDARNLLQDPDSAEHDHFASSLLEESVSKEDSTEILIEKAELREPEEPFEDEASAALVQSLVGDALGDSMASRLMTPQPEARAPCIPYEDRGSILIIICIVSLTDGRRGRSTREKQTD